MQKTPTIPHIQRQQITTAKRIVVKVGTHVLVDKTGKPNIFRIAHLVKDLALLQQSDKEVVLVTSGAIGAGLQVLNMKRSTTTPLEDLQMAAAIGQTRLMELYQKYFHRHHCIVSQVLLTHDDLKNRRRHLNARNTMLNLLAHRVIPIVNENDVVSVDEIRLGDNDVLSALVSALIDADLLILLTTPNGVQKPTTNGKMARIPYLETIDEMVLSYAIGKSSSLSIGGMASKLKAAHMAVKAGTQVVIASGFQKAILNKIISGEDIGTLIGDKIKNKYQGRKRWIAFFHKPQGTIIIDAGAQEALLNKGKSLLPVGVKGIEENFAAGALVNIINENREIIGQGLISYSSHDVKKIMGHRAAEIADILGTKGPDEIVHRDNLTFLENL